MYRVYFPWKRFIMDDSDESNMFERWQTALFFYSRCFSGHVLVYLFRSLEIIFYAILSMSGCIQLYDCYPAKYPTITRNVMIQPIGNIILNLERIKNALCSSVLFPAFIKHYPVYNPFNGDNGLRDILHTTLSRQHTALWADKNSFWKLNWFQGRVLTVLVCKHPAKLKRDIKLLRPLKYFKAKNFEWTWCNWRNSGNKLDDKPYLGSEELNKQNFDKYWKTADKDLMKFADKFRELQRVAIDVRNPLSDDGNETSIKMARLSAVHKQQQQQQQEV